MSRSPVPALQPPPHLLPCACVQGGPYHDVLHSVLGAYTCYRPDVGYVSLTGKASCALAAPAGYSQRGALQQTQTCCFSRLHLPAAPLLSSPVHAGLAVSAYVARCSLTLWLLPSRDDWDFL